MMVQDPSPDPFDPANLRLSQSFTEMAGVKKLLTNVPVKRPNPQEFVRVHPNPDYRVSFPMVEFDREHYLVASDVVSEMTGEWVPKILYLAINRQNVVFFWPVRLPGPDGKQYDWWRSSHEAAERAMSTWVRVKANQSLGAYDIAEAESAIGEPEWPEPGYWDLIKIAFRDHLITSVDHLVVKRLRGRA
jgi:hypothetical protein